jgi:hypothetical protein
MSATVRREQDGIFFGGDTGGSAPAGRASGGGGSGLEDVRWNQQTLRLEKKLAGGDWETVVQFAQFDA